MATLNEDYFTVLNSGLFTYRNLLYNHLLECVPILSIIYKVDSRYLEYSISRTLDVSNKTFGPILINLHKMTTR